MSAPQSTPRDLESNTKLDDKLSDVFKFPPLQGEPEQYLVTFDDPEDPLSAKNWPMQKKAATAFAYMLACLSSTYASATMTGTEPFLAERFHISQEVAILATSSLFLIGYTCGPLVWSPLSEYAGRKLPFVLSMFEFCLFAAGAATAKDYQTLVLCRFFQAAMGSAPMATTAAAYADMFSIYHLGAAATLFAVTVFIGPLLAPFISGFTLEKSNLGWRWCEWWSFFFGLSALISVVFLAEESYAPVILSRKAAKLRHETGNWAIHAKADEASLTTRDLLEKIVIRPARMMIQEPILLALSIYTAFVYALLYTFLVSYGIVFVEGYGMSLGVGGLPFLGLVVGMVISMIVNLNQQRYYNRWIRENSGKLIPEWRMPLCITGAVAFAVGLFWFGWTAAYPKSVHWMAPTASGVVTGYGILMIFMSCFTYMIDIYLSNAAPAFAGNAVMRSSMAAGFPLFAVQLFHNLGVQWANTLLGCIAAILILAPVLLYFYGDKIRAKSRFVMNHN